MDLRKRLITAISALFSVLWFAAAASGECLPQQPLTLRLANCSGNTQVGVDSWGAFIAAADGRNLCVMPSTFTANIYLMGTALCAVDEKVQNITFAQCQSRRGGTFNETYANEEGEYTYEPVSDLDKDRNWLAISTDSKDPMGKPGLTSLSFPNGPDLKDVIVSTIDDGQNQNVAHLGIEWANATLLEALKKAGYPYDGWGLNAGSTSVANPRPGNIVFGGYDTASVRGSFTKFEINTNPDLGAQRHCPLEVEIKSMAIIREGSDAESQSDVLIDPAAGGTKACIEPYDNLFRLSQSALDRFMEVTGYKLAGSPDPDFFVVEPGLVRNSKFGFSMAITLENGDNPVTFEIPSEELEQPRRAIDRTGKRVLQTNVTEARIFNGTVLDRIVLGKAFLSQVYVKTQFSKGTFELAPIVTDPVEPDAIAFGCTQNTGTRDLSGTVNSLKAGLIAVGVVLGVLLLVVVFMLYANSGLYGSIIREWFDKYVRGFFVKLKNR